MKKTLLAFAIFALAGTTSLMAAGVCPPTSNTTAGHECAATITIAADGSFSIANDSSATPYDGVEDSLIGIINNSSSTFTGSISLTGSNIFGFDGDGACSGYVTCTGFSGYNGPITTFTIADSDNGTADVTGLLAGDTTWFSLEENLSGAGAVNIGTPEPATFAMIGGGLGLLALARRRKK